MLALIPANEHDDKRFDKTDHEQLQFESILFKNKNPLAVSSRVDSCYNAEVATLAMLAG